MAKEISLSQGQSTIIDDEDFERVNQYKWFARKTTTYQTPNFIAVAIVKNGKTKTTVYLHRFILNAPKGLIVDHKDGNPLNNQKSNLRLCSASQNQANKAKTRISTTGFKGVTFYAKNNKFRAKIGIKGRYIHLGYFETADEASEAYKTAARLYQGDFAKE